MAAGAAAGPPPAPLAEAQAALERGEPGRAEALFRAAAAADPASPPAYLGLARSLAAQGKGDQAAAVLRGVGERWLGWGRYEPAEELLETAVGLAPDSSEGHLLLGRARLLRRQYLAAEGPLERALELGRHDVRTLLYLGSVRWENGRIAAAEEAFRQALAESGRAPLALHQLGRLLLWQGRAGEAVGLLREATAGEPGAVDVELDLAAALAGSGETAAALVAFVRAVELAPEHTRAHYGLARLLARLGRREEAAVELDRYRELYQADQERTRRAGLEQAALNAGLAKLHRGEVAAAVEHLSALPETVDVLAALGAAWSAAGEPARAAAALERALALEPERRDLRALLAEARLAAAEEQ